jgi:methylaspartate ammonia-lyase
MSMFKFVIRLQISQLLETLQKDPQKLAVEGEKMAEFINSLTGDEASLDSQTPSPRLHLQKDGTLSYQVHINASRNPDSKFNTTFNCCLLFRNA